MGQFSEVTCSNPLQWNDLTTESLKKSSVTASWHVYHRELARFHSPDKSRYDRYCRVCLNFFSFILFACMCMHASLSMWESEWKDRGKEGAFALKEGEKKKTIVTVVEAQHARQRGGESWQERRKQAGKKQCVIILLRKQAYVPSTAWKPRIFSTGRIWIGLSRLNEVTSANWAAQHVMMG